MSDSTSSQLHVLAQNLQAKGVNANVYNMGFLTHDEDLLICGHVSVQQKEQEFLIHVGNNSMLFDQIPIEEIESAEQMVKVLSAFKYV